MIRPIVKDIFFLGRKAEKADRKDASWGKDLLDTLRFHKNHCVGLAGNMIGCTKAVIAIMDKDIPMVMYNPVITKVSSETYETEEGCLSLEGRRPCTRHRWIEVSYEDEKFRKKKKRFSGFTAEIIEHETDHLQGILI